MKTKRELEADRAAAAEVDRTSNWIRDNQRPGRAEIERALVYAEGRAAGLRAAQEACHAGGYDCCGRCEFDIGVLLGSNESLDDFRRRYEARMKEENQKHDEEPFSVIHGPVFTGREINGDRLLRRRLPPFAMKEQDDPLLFRDPNASEPSSPGCGACDFYAPLKCPRHSA